MQVKEELAYYTPDQIAECIPGVSKELYTALWDVVCHLESIGMTDGETPDARVYIGEVFHLLDADMQKQVNALTHFLESQEITIITFLLSCLTYLVFTAVGVLAGSWIYLNLIDETKGN